ncbi:hypothetical protein ACFPN4_14220 [Ureibacillus thermophilus]|uniref:hypothetical protein n=1 Tax=Ureibacillus TaxID=160795 RepID=UPI0030C8D7EA
MDFKMFESVYQSHIATMGPLEKEKHRKENIVKIEKDLNHDCINVYFQKDGWSEWYRYYPNGTWG